MAEAEREIVFRALFEQYLGELTRLARLLGADDAEDVAQEAFVRLHRLRVPLTGDPPVIRRLRATVVRLTRKRPARPDRPLAGLARRHREVLVLRYGLDIGTTDLAETLALSPHAVEAATHRALEQLGRPESRSRIQARSWAAAVAAALVVVVVPTSVLVAFPNGPSDLAATDTTRSKKDSDCPISAGPSTPWIPSTSTSPRPTSTCSTAAWP